MKRKISLCMLATLFWVGIWAGAQAETLDDNEYVATESSTLTVRGHGEVSAVPDRAILRLGA
ncbi:MAG: SIMPL domain-containing protein, partial [Desulfobacterales bacterium]